jgi:signal transduction histidine kinase
MTIATHRRRTWQAALLYASIVGISLLHYVTPTTQSFMWLHPVYARAFYVPLLLIALFWGWRAGLAGALLATLSYAPHVLHAWAGEHEEFMVSQLIEMAMFFVVTAIAGVLADHERGQRKKIEDTATALTRVNRQLQESFEHLRRAERLSALGELAAGLAHEIRNPLGSVEGALRIVSRPELPEATRQEFRDLAQGEVERLKELVSSFLDFARPAAAQPSPTSPGQLLQSVEHLVSETAGIARVAVHTEAQIDVREILVDPQQIKQVLLNLAINSIQAMPGGGNLVLRAYIDRGVVVFEVQDEGVGVLDEEMEKIFDPFFTTRADGTGLGLSIAHRIVNQHGGQIRARRNPDRGMTFAVEIPLEASDDRTTAGFLPRTNHPNKSQAGSEAPVRLVG